MTKTQILEQLFSVNDKKFKELALAVFHYQYAHNKVYHQYVDLVQKDISTIQSITQIPFLPIQFFKSHRVLCDDTNVNLPYFESSGTAGQITSKHYIVDYTPYQSSFRKGFQHFFGHIKDYVILGLLPSYLERNHSSLVFMVQDLIQQSQHPLSGFYLHNHAELFQVLTQLEKEKKQALLFGVTFALLDFAEKYPLKLSSVKVIETGGMKGRREEMTRHEVHQLLAQSFSTQSIYSEYGMTELFSQAYSLSDELFQSPSWMKILSRDLNDPLEVNNTGKGGINCIDLANINTCSFIATEDMGEVYENGSFTIQGRIDHSELRGCSLMAL